MLYMLYTIYQYIHFLYIPDPCHQHSGPSADCQLLGPTHCTLHCTALLTACFVKSSPLVSIFCRGLNI